MKKVAKTVWSKMRAFIHMHNDNFFFGAGAFIGKAVEGKYWEGILLAITVSFILFVIRRIIK